MAERPRHPGSGPARLLRRTEARLAVRSRLPARPSTSRSSAGPTLETSPTQQVCWPRKLPRNTPDRVTFVSENFGDSKLADQFGVKGYPAVFVDDVLVAAPRDFGYFGEVEGTGRYAPWRNADNQAKFKADLVAHDRPDPGREKRHRQPRAPQPHRRPSGDRGSSPVQTYRSFRPSAHRRAALRPRCAGRVLGYLVPAVPLHSGMARRSKSQAWRQARHPRASRRISRGPDSLDRWFASPDLHWAITDAPTAQSFGDITAVPTLFLFDRSGKTARILYGAPPDLHDQVEKSLDSLLQ